MLNAASIINDSLVTTLQSIAELTGKVFSVLTEDELIKLSAIIPFPGVAVVYEGMTSTQREAGNGRASTIHFSIVVFYKVDGILGPSVAAGYKQTALNLLDTIRNAIAASSSPNGKRWQFSSEMSPLQKGTLTLWIQRWNLPVILM